MLLTKRSALRKSDVREANERLLLNIIRQNQGVSRADIARITGFSPSSVTFVVNRMIRDGLLSESPSDAPAQVGRRPLILRLQPHSLLAVGVEITRTEARIACAGLDGSIHKMRTVQWQQDHRVFLARVRDAIRAVAGKASSDRLLGVGVSLAGTIDRTTGYVIAAENLGWFGVDVGQMLSEGLPAPFYYENDAKLSALAERWCSEPGTKQLDNFVFLTLSPGLGTGVVIEGRLFHGSTGEASEFGHTTLFHDGRRCVCGSTGCWEEYASQRAMERLYSERCGAACPPPMPAADEIIRLARQGDALALEVLRETAAFVGMGCANLNAAFNPEAIIVGDYLASAWDLMEDWVWDSIRQWAPNRYLTHLRLIPSRHGRDSALMGALALVLSNFFTGSAQNNGKGSTPQPSLSRRSN
jgi:predicted NBD/HSP70 family sugar kinase